MRPAVADPANNSGFLQKLLPEVWCWCRATPARLALPPIPAHPLSQLAPQLAPRLILDAQLLADFEFLQEYADCARLVSSDACAARASARSNLSSLSLPCDMDMRCGLHPCLCMCMSCVCVRACTRGGATLGSKRALVFLPLPSDSKISLLCAQ